MDVLCIVLHTFSLKVRTLVFKDGFATVLVAPLAGAELLPQIPIVALETEYFTKT